VYIYVLCTFMYCVHICTFVYTYVHCICTYLLGEHGHGIGSLFRRWQSSLKEEFFEKFRLPSPFQFLS
jgi:hypothetical protein